MPNTGEFWRGSFAARALGRPPAGTMASRITNVGNVRYSMQSVVSNRRRVHGGSDERVREVLMRFERRPVDYAGPRWMLG